VEYWLPGCLEHACEQMVAWQLRVWRRCFEISGLFLPRHLHRGDLEQRTVRRALERSGLMQACWNWY